MKAISLWQPWASLLAAGAKRVETRSWALPGPFPRVLAVHAAKKWDGALAKLCRTEPFRSALAAFGVPSGGHSWTGAEVEAARAGFSLPFGALVGVVLVASCHETERLLGARFGSGKLIVGEKEYAFGDYSPGRWGWVCDDFHAFPEPVPCRGFQGIFNVELPEGLELPEWAGVAQRSVP